MSLKYFFLSFPFFLLTSLSVSGTTLWYEQPAGKWEEALPLGNGRLGAVVYSLAGKPCVVRYGGSKKSLDLDKGEKRVVKF